MEKEDINQNKTIFTIILHSYISVNLKFPFYKILTLVI